MATSNSKARNSNYSQIRCFSLEPTHQVELSLRRYRGSDRDKCAASGYGYHNASVIVERTSISALRDRGRPMKENRKPANAIDTIPRNNPRWPQICPCGYQFANHDKWQCNAVPLFRRSDNGELVTLAGAPAGAMWNAEWIDCKGPDGISLVVRTPGGDWPIDGPSYKNGKIHNKHGWTRSGAIPAITVDRELVIPGKYRGFLRGGWLDG